MIRYKPHTHAINLHLIDMTTHTDRVSVMSSTIYHQVYCCTIIIIIMIFDYIEYNSNGDYGLVMISDLSFWNHYYYHHYRCYIKYTRVL